jgi:hypothetical protein
METNVLVHAGYLAEAVLTNMGYGTLLPAFECPIQGQW